jgi:AraC family transcriptional regulator
MLILTEGHHIGSTLNSFKADDFIASKTVLSGESFNDRIHYHDNAHFSFVLRGGCGEKKKNPYERVPGSITWYRAGELHQITRVTGSSYHLNIELLPCFFQKYGLKEDILSNTSHRHAGTSATMIKIYRELSETNPCRESSLRMLLINLLMGEVRTSRTRVPGWVSRVHEILHDRWNERVTLEELSDACGIHPVSISKYFPAYFSCTLNEYCRKLKIDRAICLMMDSRLSLTEIAYQCGFADQSHFTRTFKALTGFLPSAYQKL